MEEQVRGVLLERDVAEDNDQPVAAQPDQHLRQPPCYAAWSRATQSMAIANKTRWPSCMARSPSPVARVGIAGSGWPEQDDVGRFGEERTGRKVRDDVAFEAGLVVETKVLK